MRMIGNVKARPKRKPMAKPEWPRALRDERGILHIELENTTTKISLHTQTVANGVRLVYDSVGRLVAIDVAPGAGEE